MKYSGLILDITPQVGPEPDSETLYDNSRARNHGTLKASGEPNYIWTGKCWVLDYDGTDDRIDIAHTNDLNLTTGGTVMAWINPDGYGENNSGRIFDKGYSDGWIYYVDKYLGLYPILTFSANGGAGINSASNSWSIGTWVHVSVTVTKAGLVTHYINGQVSGTPASTNAMSSNTNTGVLSLGNIQNDTTRTFDGKQYNYKIFKYVKNQKVISDIYESERSLFS